MSHEHHHEGGAVESTERIEVFSDGVFAIILTLLVLELHVPEITLGTTTEFLSALIHLVPSFTAFALSFFTIAIFWVNHHHFFHGIEKADWKLMWFNIIHLFFIAIIPFTTAFVGTYHTALVPVVLYAVVLTLAAASFMVMIRYVFFGSKLMRDGIPEIHRKKEFKRGMNGVYLYLSAAILTFVNVYLAIVLLILTPILFVVPRLFSDKTNA
jgi:uncharacterized membrane protein